MTNAPLSPSRTPRRKARHDESMTQIATVEKNFSPAASGDLGARKTACGHDRGVRGCGMTGAAIRAEPRMTPARRKGKGSGGEQHQKAAGRGRFGIRAAGGLASCWARFPVGGPDGGLAHAIAIGARPLIAPHASVVCDRKAKREESLTYTILRVF